MASAAAPWRSPSPSPPLVLHLKGTFRGCTVSAPKAYWSLRTAPLSFYATSRSRKPQGLAELTHARYLPLLPSTARARAATLHTLRSQPPLQASPGISRRRILAHRLDCPNPRPQIEHCFSAKWLGVVIAPAAAAVSAPGAAPKGDIPRPSSGLAERLHLLTRAFLLRQPSISNRISGLPSQIALVAHHNGGIISPSRAQRWLPPRTSGRQPRRWP